MRGSSGPYGELSARVGRLESLLGVEENPRSQAKRLEKLVAAIRRRAIERLVGGLSEAALARIACWNHPPCSHPAGEAHHREAVAALLEAAWDGGPDFNDILLPSARRLTDEQLTSLIEKIRRA